MKKTFLAVLAAFSLTLGSALASDWPGFRGNSGGVSAEKDLPVKWSKDNFLWKVKLPGPGTSSPIISEGKLFVTCYTGYGTTITKGMSGKGGFGKGGKGGGKGGFGKGGGDTGGDQKQLKLVLMCIDPHNGKTLWQKEIKPRLPEAPFSGFMREHGYASSTPITDGERVYVFFGKSGVYAFDIAGKQVWQADVGTNTDKWGTGSSPVLYKDLVIVNAAIESRSLVALDKRTGKEAWRARGVGTSWTSPIIAETKDGKHEVVMSQPGKVVGYDPETGKELWHCQGIGSSGGFGGGYTASTPVTKDGVVYVIGGGGFSSQATAIAVRAGGRGEVDKTHVLWRQKAGTSTASPVLCGDGLCFVAGSATCLDRDSGKSLYREYLYGARGEYVSAVAAGNRVYALTRSDGLFVLAGGSKFEKLAHNEFSDDSSIFNASPAISDGKLYIRSNAYLYCVGNSAK